MFFCPNLISDLILVAVSNSILGLKKLEKAGIPAGPVLDINEMHRDPHVIERNMIVSPIHSFLGPTKTIGCPVKFSKTKSSITRSAPLYGEHTKIILGEIGYNKKEIKDLISSEAENLLHQMSD